MQNITENQILDQNLNENCAAIQHYTEIASENGIDAGQKRLCELSEEDLRVRRKKMRHVRAYLTQLVNTMWHMIVPDHSAYMILDEDGCLIRIKAAPEISAWIESKGIVLGTVWRLDDMGPNAITLGQQDRKPHITIGEENYLELLRDAALYYAPMEITHEGELFNLGGIAIITPEENQHTSYQMLAAAFSGTIMIRLIMSWSLSSAYESDPRGVVMLDINQKNAICSITHHNKMFFDILELPRESNREVYFKNAEEFFDPLPYNKTFWTIIREQRQVENQEIAISVKGKVLDRIISTYPTYNRKVCNGGIMLYITSRQQQVQQAAEKTGNNAIITFDDIVGSSLIMRSRIKRARLLANTDSNILLLGESGVGKDVFAQAIHNQSARRNGPFVAVNCGALPRDLIASELFGYEGGAFTGARKQGNIGKFELANGGTLFLDEIGEMPLDLQATLLRAVEQKQFMRLGSSKVVHTNVRILSATNVDITQMIQEKKFRADLYYRLCTMSLYLPPMRERGKDIILLAESFIRKICAKIGRDDVMVLTEGAKEFLLACEWHGNVRELQNLMECLVQLYPEHEITLEMIRENVDPSYFIGMDEEAAESAAQLTHTNDIPPEIVDLSPIPTETVTEELPERPAAHEKVALTKEVILAALEAARGNRSKAAKQLGIGRRTLYRYIEQFEIGNK